MHGYLKILSKSLLFKGINEDDLSAVLNCLKADIKSYKKGQFIFMSGDKVSHIGVILSGSVHITRDSYEGERMIISSLSEGDFFAESICCAGIEASPVNAFAYSDTGVLFIGFSRILHSCSNSCVFHSQLIENMISIIAQKNLILQARLAAISKKSLRLKILDYLQSIAVKQGTYKITIPFNREELAEYLCADRSALSHELSRMKRDGLIDYNKNHFKLFYK